MAIINRSDIIIILINIKKNLNFVLIFYFFKNDKNLLFNYKLLKKILYLINF